MGRKSIEAVRAGELALCAMLRTVESSLSVTPSLTANDKMTKEVKKEIAPMSAFAKLL
jgi:hypothetical protein